MPSMASSHSFEDDDRRVGMLVFIANLDAGSAKNVLTKHRCWPER
jgi:hypothetical protein